MSLDSPEFTLLVLFNLVLLQRHGYASDYRMIKEMIKGLLASRKVPE